MVSTMIYYIYFFLFLILSIFSYIKRNKDVHIIFTIITIYTLTFMCACRFETGNDYNAYVNIYNETNTLLSRNSQIEHGFNILIYLLKAIGFNSQSIFFISGLFISCGITWLCYQYDHKFYYFLVFLFYSKLYFYTNMSVIRQGWALIFCYIALNQRNLIKGFLFIILGYLFHVSSIVFIPIIVALRIKNIRFWKILFFLSFVFLEVIL